MSHDNACVQVLHMHVPGIPDQIRGEIERILAAHGRELFANASFCWVMPTSILESFDTMCDALAFARDIAHRNAWPELVTALRQADNFRAHLDRRLGEAMTGKSDAERIDFCRGALIREPSFWHLPTWVATMKAEPPSALMDLWGKVMEADRAYAKVAASRASELIPWA